MRFAAIADVHGNDLALEAIVADIRGQGIRAGEDRRGLRFDPSWLRSQNKTAGE
jgi:hypothetical protein